MSETGIARIGMIEARQVCRNRITTSTTRITASAIVWITASTDCAMNSVGLWTTRYSRPSGKSAARSSIVARIVSAVSSAFEPGRWKISSGSALSVPR